MTIAGQVIQLCRFVCVWVRMIKRFGPHMGVYMLADYFVAKCNGFKRKTK